MFSIDKCCLLLNSKISDRAKLGRECSYFFWREASTFYQDKKTHWRKLEGVAMFFIWKFRHLAHSWLVNSKTNKKTSCHPVLFLPFFSWACDHQLALSDPTTCVTVYYLGHEIFFLLILDLKLPYFIVNTKYFI